MQSNPKKEVICEKYKRKELICEKYRRKELIFEKYRRLNPKKEGVDM